MKLEEIKEAVEVIKAYRQMLTDSVSNQIDGDIKAFDVAVEAMEQEACGDCVSRQAVLNKIFKFSVTDGKSVSVSNLLTEIIELPPVKPQRMGHWIYDDIANNWRCSECGETPKTLGYCGTADFMAEHFRYCNHCGIRMVEPQESEE